MTADEVVMFIESTKARRQDLRKEVASTNNWWIGQLDKHRPDLATKRDDNLRELSEIEKTLGRLGLL